MLAEFGHLSLITALVVSLLLGVIPLCGRYSGNAALLALARPATLLLFFLVLLAYSVLTYAFVVHDFSLAYVAHNSNSQLPLIYRISGVWGAHEGSILLWILCLCGWAGIFAWRSSRLPLPLAASILGVLGAVVCGFLLFSIATSNPFERILPPPGDGRDLNPLLQDPGLAIHPPMLYIGYVGFAIAFAFAIGAMIEGKLDANWARWLKPWVNCAWGFLTLGIALGSWWAYYELGWGGWWFWDPVENASFMPWLVATALLHSLTATEQRGVSKAWTLLLAILAFALSLLGTFLVRSGVLTSVHAFANDPERGLFILILLALVIGSSLFFYSLRAHMFTEQRGFSLISREAALLVNNVFLVVIACTVLLGTLYPIIIDALQLGKLSVGPPYFNRVIVPLAVPLFLALGIGSLLRWEKDSFASHMRVLAPATVLALLCGLLAPLAASVGYDWRIALGSTLAAWISATMLISLAGMLRKARPPLSIWAMVLGHLGLAVFCFGVTFANSNSVEMLRSIAPGESANIKDYTLTFAGVSSQNIDNYEATIAEFQLWREDELLTTLYPEKRFYPVQRNLMTEAAIHPRLSHDLFIALGEELANEAWSVRIQYKSFIRWIWIGALVMAIAAFMESFSLRYRVKQQQLRGHINNTADSPGNTASTLASHT